MPRSYAHLRLDPRHELGLLVTDLVMAGRDVRLEHELGHAAGWTCRVVGRVGDVKTWRAAASAVLEREAVGRVLAAVRARYVA